MPVSESYWWQYAVLGTAAKDVQLPRALNHQGVETGDPLTFITDPLPSQIPEENQISWFEYRSVVQICPRLVRFFDTLQWIVACSVMFFLNWISFNGVIIYYITGQVLPILAPINRLNHGCDGCHNPQYPAHCLTLKARGLLGELLGMQQYWVGAGFGFQIMPQVSLTM